METIEEQLKDIQKSLNNAFLENIFGKGTVELGKSVFGSVQR